MRGRFFLDAASETRCLRCQSGANAPTPGEPFHWVAAADFPFLPCKQNKLSACRLGMWLL